MCGENYIPPVSIRPCPCSLRLLGDVSSITWPPLCHWMWHTGRMHSPICNRTRYSIRNHWMHCNSSTAKCWDIVFTCRTLCRTISSLKGTKASYDVAPLYGYTYIGVQMCFDTHKQMPSETHFPVIFRIMAKSSKQSSSCLLKACFTWLEFTTLPSNRLRHTSNLEVGAVTHYSGISHVCK